MNELSAEEQGESLRPAAAEAPATAVPAAVPATAAAEAPATAEATPVFRVENQLLYFRTKQDIHKFVPIKVNMVIIDGHRWFIRAALQNLPDSVDMTRVMHSGDRVYKVVEKKSVRCKSKEGRLLVKAGQSEYNKTAFELLDAEHHVWKNVMSFTEPGPAVQEIVSIVRGKTTPEPTDDQQ